MSHRFSTVWDLRNWVDQATANWDGRTERMIDDMVEMIRAKDHPRWDTDWSKFLESLDLTKMVELVD